MFSLWKESVIWLTVGILQCSSWCCSNQGYKTDLVERETGIWAAGPGEDEDGQGTKRGRGGGRGKEMPSEKSPLRLWVYFRGHSMSKCLRPPHCVLVVQLSLCGLVEFMSPRAWSDLVRILALILLVLRDGGIWTRKKKELNLFESSMIWATPQKNISCLTVQNGWGQV